MKIVCSSCNKSFVPKIQNIFVDEFDQDDAGIVENQHAVLIVICPLCSYVEQLLATFWDESKIVDKLAVIADPPNFELQ